MNTLPLHASPPYSNGQPHAHLQTKRLNSNLVDFVRRIYGFRTDCILIPYPAQRRIRDQNMCIFPLISCIITKRQSNWFHFTWKLLSFRSLNETLQHSSNPTSTTTCFLTENVPFSWFYLLIITSFKKIYHVQLPSCT